MPDYERPLDPGQSEAELRALLANVCDDEQVLAEAKQPVSEGLTTLLMEHQVIGVNWMKRQEASSNKGGILSDDMGLGKTLQAIALIKERPCDPATLTEASSSGEKTKTKGTLVICPVSLISQWQREIYTKTNPPLSVLVYHGTSRPSDPRKLLAYDVVISSYHVLIQDYGKNDTYTGPLAKLKWHRVILDEAHVIKNKATSMARSCCLVDAQYRWCLTATPIQNKIEELFSLIKFLRIRPYCEWDEFREEISKPMRQGLHKRALKKVQILLKAISLRRSKQAKINGKPILQLPERTVHFTHIDFSPDERQFYEYINSKAQARFNKYLEAGTVMKNYSSVLVLLLRLRQACLHPSLTLKENPDEEEESECKKEKIARTMTSTVVNRLLHENTNFSDIECPICMDMADQAQIIAGCGHILCRECLFNYINTADGLVKRCPQCRGPLDRECVTSLEAFLKVHARDLYNTFVKDNSVTEETAAAISRAKEFLSSAKIDKLLEILQETHETTGGQDKTIVFSQFMGMLDIVETALKQKGYKTVRYDGSMNVKQRDAALACFFANPEVTVLLVSTKCGSLGLNLTVANRVVMMDIWWNPALENQAIDRVHRIGQTKPVEVHRIFITDTVEDRILELQKKKQALCDGALGEGTGRPLGRLGLNEMLYLFRGGTLRGDDDDD
ncbi:SNF2 family N-terminal domain-containing protein [Radiomyces spectabilis]|uniref:SNF2 family N-terminal domain-containing protein n=1 Tax=Radiomyces spectabilis TaxID=64574 RepID=UPI00222036D7|nr:SNF2 family N-terminal domain-containing protein [Radiomyces spectabilis]KAI8381219.1 SNF2 family N-terminal domain-containing protein [Radiomyces spectabilis]